MFHFIEKKSAYDLDGKYFEFIHPEAEYGSIFSYIIHRELERMCRSSHQYPCAWSSHVYYVECYCQNFSEIQKQRRKYCSCEANKFAYLRS